MKIFGAFLSVILMLSSAGAFASECTIKVFTLSCGNVPNAGYGCLRPFPWWIPAEKTKLDASLDECIASGLRKKAEYLSNGSDEEARQGESTRIFDRIKISYNGPEGRISATLKR